MDNVLKVEQPQEQLEVKSDHNNSISERIAQWHAQQKDNPVEEAEETIILGKSAEKPEELVEETQPESPVEKDQETSTEDEKPAEKIEETKYVLKINEEEREVSEKDLITWAQKGLASEEKFQKASLQLKEAQTLHDAAQTIYQCIQKDPMSSLDQMFGEEKVTQMVEQYLAKKIEYMALPEETKQLQQAQQEAARWKSEAEKIKQAEATKQQQLEVRAAEASLDQRMRVALKAKGLPEDKEYLYRTLLKMDRAWDEQQQTTIPIEQAVEELWQDLIREQKLLLDSLPADEIASKFGDAAKKIHKADLKRVQSKGPTKKAVTAKSKSTERTREQKQQDYLKKRVDLPIFD